MTLVASHSSSSVTVWLFFLLLGLIKELLLVQGAPYTVLKQCQCLAISDVMAVLNYAGTLGHRVWILLVKKHLARV